MNDPAPPLAILGLPLKPIVALAVFLFVLVFEFQGAWRTNLTDHLKEHLNLHDGGTDSKTSDMIVTEEMIGRAMQEIAARQVKEQEQATDSPDTSFIYYIELASGGSLVTADLVIQPDRLILTSASGIRAEIPRESVTNIRRIARPPERP